MHCRYPALKKMSLTSWFLFLLLYSACGKTPEYTGTPAAVQADSAAPRTAPVVTASITLDTTTPHTGYEQLFIDAGLTNVQSLDSNIRVELKYSTTDNFLGTDVYGELTNCYLLPEVAARLVKARKALDKEHPGYHLLCYDCARPRRVQRVMWDLVKMPNKKDYVASPDEGSIHNYGAAVDLTVTDERGVPLDMGTAYDFFGPLAWPDQEAAHLRDGTLTQEQYANRLILRKAMQAAGFSRIHTEWWHFNAWPLEVVKERYQIVE
jgi:D-alanyl-D-alanine dipeptidase